MKVGKGRTNVLAGVCIAGIAASSAVMVAAYDSDDPSRAYFGTDSRASQLLVGALLAIALARWSPSSRGQRRGVQVIGLAGAAFMLWAFTSTTDTQSWLYYGGFLLFAIATAAVIARDRPADRTHRSGWVLSLGPMRWIGLISYGLYLYHWPVVVAISEPRTGLSGWDLALVRIGVTFLIAILSFYLVEMPIRRGALKGSVARVAAPAAFVIVAGVSIVLTSGGQAPPDFLGASPGSVVESGPRPTLAPTVTGAPDGAQVGSVLLVGDSVAASLGDALQLEAATSAASLSRRRRAPVVGSSPACPPPRRARRCRGVRAAPTAPRRTSRHRSPSERRGPCSG